MMHAGIVCSVAATPSNDLSKGDVIMGTYRVLQLFIADLDSVVTWLRETILLNLLTV